MESSELIRWTYIALLAVVKPHLRAVTIGYRAKGYLPLICYFDGPISAEDEEDVYAVTTEIEAHYWWNEDDPTVEWKAIRIDEPSPVPWEDFLIYHRYEPAFKLKNDPFPIPHFVVDPITHWENEIIGLSSIIGHIVPEWHSVQMLTNDNEVILFVYNMGPISNLSREQCDLVALDLSRKIAPVTVGIKQIILDDNVVPPLLPTLFSRHQIYGENWRRLESPIG